MIHRNSNKNFRRFYFSRLYPLPFPNKLMGNFFAFHNFCLLSFSIRCWVALGSTGKIIARLECWKILEKSFQLHFRIMNLNLIIFVSTFCVLHLWTWDNDHVDFSLLREFLVMGIFEFWRHLLREFFFNFYNLPQIIRKAMQLCWRFGSFMHPYSELN